MSSEEEKQEHAEMAPTRRSSRRVRTSSKKDARRAALEAMREARTGKRGTRIERYELQEEEDVYDVVSEEQYTELVKERRKGNEFVVDDDGLGYYDDGEEHLFDVDGRKTKEHSVGKGASAGALSFDAIKRARELDAKRKGEQRKVSAMFLKNSNVIGPQTMNAGTKKSKVEDAAADELLDSMLSELGEGEDKEAEGEDAASQLIGNKRKILAKENPLLKAKAARIEMENIALFTNNAAKVQEAHALPIPEVPKDKKPEVADIDDAMDIGIDYDDATPSVSNASEERTESVKKEEQPMSAQERAANYMKNRRRRMFLAAKQAASKKLNKKEPPSTASVKTEVVESETVASKCDEEGAWARVSLSASAEREDESDCAPTTSPSMSTAVASSKYELPLEADKITVGRGSRKREEKYMYMFWTDICSLPQKPDTLYIFGKVRTSPPGTPKNKEVYRSCCVKVPGLEYILHVLPKQDEIGPDGETASRSMEEVHKEVSGVLQKLMHRGRFSFRSRPVKKRYAFELRDVPRDETEYLEVRYPASAPALDDEISGSSFSRIFGTHTSGLEHFILERDLMGPGWIKIIAPQKTDVPFSWCALEATVAGPRFVVRACGENRPPPPLVVMSISLQTVMSAKSNTHEVAMVSALTHRGVFSDGATENVDAVSHFTAVRPAVKGGMPLDLRAVVRGNPRWAGKLEITGNERALLNYFVARVHKIDPDVIVGHNIYGFDLDVLLHRMKQNKISMWSKLGRLRLGQMPKSIDGNNGLAHFLGQLARGRLVCDTYLAARELVRETSYRLVELARTRLKMQPPKEVRSPDVPNYFSSSKQLIQLAMLTENKAYLALRLMFKLEVIPLTKQITCLAGNLWNRTLKGARAERIEYLLLHEFHRLGYVVPDKKYLKKRGGKSAGRRKKAAYAGGLVLEPKKGLYDRYVLLLDFNSLYPSIIREYNICFTTVDRTHILNDEEMEEQQLKRQREAEERGVAMSELEAPANAPPTLPELPSRLAKGEKFAPLPSVIHHLVQRRYQVKKMLKKEKVTSQRIMLDIRQKALKILANSMYGCLGFSFSRFYAKPIAALVTSEGRKILQNTVDLATQLGFDVIYGDTDSIMINTNTDDLTEVREIGKRIKKEVNKLYSLLEIEIDGIYKTMLLLKKKKYAALVVQNDSDGKISLSRELKGLDMVRRDWCPLSKDIGSQVLDFIMSGRPRDEVVDSIHGLIADRAAAIREAKVPLGKFIITKGLNKAPHLYPNAASQPHLQVALSMIKEGRPVNAGDHIPYVICKGTEDGVKQTPAQRARAPDVILRSKKTDTPLEVDAKWYLEHQILPPISRLCNVIEGTSQGNLAEAMGLDSSRYVQRDFGDDGGFDDDWAFAAKSLMDDAERFKNVEALLVPPRTGSARKFSGSIVPEFRGVLPNIETKRNDLAATDAPRREMLRWSDLSEDPDADASVVRLDNQLVLQTRKYIRRYYDCVMQCEDPACGAVTRFVRTRDHGRGHACVIPGCRGVMYPTYSSKQLYTQFQYFEGIMDVPRAEKKKQRKAREDAASAKKGNGTARGTETATEHSIPSTKDARYQDLEMLKENVHGTLTQSAYNWIQPGLWRSIFT